MNVRRNVKPRDLGDGPACLPLAVLFWSGAALIAFGPVLLLTLLSAAWAQPMAGLAAWARVAMFQVGTIAVLLTPVYFAPGIRRLARAARFALLGPPAAAIALAVLFCLYRTLP
ncbi:hypothetical protein ACF05L_38405 [Streptomyces bobili]|uniref:hypothetical protein n=1 Tax=Streptomyces bobili TaxID=67280 RepID=UPI0037001C85